MNIQIKTTNIVLTPAIDDYVHKKFEAVNKFLKNAPEDLYCLIDVGKTTTHHKKGEFFRADVTITFDGRKLYASSEQEDLYAAIDDVKDELVRELKTVKEKKMAGDRKSGLAIKKIVKGIK